MNRIEKMQRITTTAELNALKEKSFPPFEMLSIR